MEKFNSYQSAANNFPIDYFKIAEAIKFYESKGFEYIEVPWDTPKKYQEATYMGEDFYPIGDDRYLVGSSEQSFVYLLDNGHLTNGKYITCSPCFRGGEISEIHQEYFMKAELFDNTDCSELRLKEIVDFACEFFAQYSPVFTQKTGDLSYDIVTPLAIEVGSYGIREYKELSWIYGTAIAEPRFSKAIALFSWLKF